LPQTTTFDNVLFIGNFAQYGGGFLETSLGSMPKLTIYDSMFADNQGTIEGGAGMVLNHVDGAGFELSLLDNFVDATGSNFGGGECDGDNFIFFIDSPSDIPECIPVSQHFVYRPSDAGTAFPTNFISPTSTLTSFGELN
jgi:hypothetical protein